MRTGTASSSGKPLRFSPHASTSVPASFWVPGAGRRPYPGAQAEADMGHGSSAAWDTAPWDTATDVRTSPPRIV